ncbi:DUF3108 domain-containing protein [Candidatus Electronema sp. JC]|uniref:DUF3108 domain-containing protein n=1 Tax=Candidatus Electronema sp. JC TaxID=3401570 RepID=UPI003B43898F
MNTTEQVPLRQIGFFFVALLALLCGLPLHAAEPALLLQPEALAAVYSGQETMRFSISWSGGIKIGDLRLSLAPAASGGGQVITARVTDYGIFRAVYPVDDTFATLISGPLKLPRRYDVLQIERGKTVRRLTRYDQRTFTASYRKQEQATETFALAGPVYNEFSAFFITRALRLDQAGQQQRVPVFADKKRHLVPIKVLGRERRNSLFGTVPTLKVQPKMAFKGLYDKDGDTVFWLTDDACRIPVEIRSKILIGSLVAELVEYSSPACPQRLNSASPPGR